MTEQSTITEHAGEGQAPPPTVWGTFQARDAKAMIEFLTAIGFEATAVYGEGDVIDHAQLDWPEGGGVMFGSHKPEGWSLPPGGAGFYVVAADPVAVHERAVRAGAEIVRALNEPGYGGWEFGLRDPEGNQWSFGSYRGEPRATS
ncbi:MAG: VOC family protein [Marmoricola sp.]